MREAGTGGLCKINYKRGKKYLGYVVFGDLHSIYRIINFANIAEETEDNKEKVFY